MAFGIDTHEHHLDDTVMPLFLGYLRGLDPNLPGPAFAGRHFLAGVPGQVVWGHGEGSAAQAQMSTLTHIVPVQGPPRSRQETKGDAGLRYGRADAQALCEKLDRTINAGAGVTGQLTIPNPRIAKAFVFLDVEDGARLSVAYWAGWADAVYKYMMATVETIDLGGGVTAPVPSLPQPFLPAIRCRFQQDAGSGKYVPDPGVKACLDGVLAAHPHHGGFCFAFWARTPDYVAQPPPSIQPPTSFAATFAPYGQPLPPGADTTPVPVVLWQYLPGTNFPTFLESGLDTSDDSLVNFFGTDPTRYMLSVTAGWAIGANNVYSWGFDTDSDTTAAAASLPAEQITGTLVDGSHVANEDISFVARYYRVSGWVHVRPAEAQALARSFVPLAVVWESPIHNPAPPPAHLWPTGPAYLNAVVASLDGADHSPGFNDAVHAFRYAANTIGQPGHTPVYFAIDFDAQDAASITAYFADVAAGYRYYLADQVRRGLEPIPYAIGVYGSDFTLDACYGQGIASYFWQSVSPGLNHRHNRSVWSHDNMWQRSTHLGQHTHVGAIGADFDMSWGDEGSFQVKWP